MRWCRLPCGELYEAGEGTGRTATEDEIYRAFLTEHAVIAAE